MIKIYTDGSSRGNPGPGGWGAILIDENKVKEIGGHGDTTTNNRMELTACIEALKLASDFSDERTMTVYSDSEYVVKGMTLWIFGWQKKGWRTAAKKDVLNRDLWEKLLSVSQEKEVKWLHVRGHASNKWNNRCDEIATAYADMLTIDLYSGPLPDYLK